MPATKLRRHFITGEWEEVPCDTEDGHATFVHDGEKVVEGRPEIVHKVSAWNDPWVSRQLAVPAHQMEQANRAAQEAGTGAYYQPVTLPSGKKSRYAACHCPSRKSRNLELARKGKGDSDAGYGDRAPKTG